MEHIAEHLVFDSGYHQLFLILPATGILLYKLHSETDENQE